MSQRAAIFQVVALSAALSLLGAGCAGGGREGRAPVASGGTGDAAPAGPTIIESMHRGIEVHRLLDRPYRQTLAPILARYSAEPLGLSEAQIAMWRNEGLRLVAVPADEAGLKELVVQMTGEPLVERIRMGVVPEWRAVATAQRIEGSKLVRVGGEIGPFADGRFRLLVRAYPLMGVAEPTLRLELMVQFHQPRRDPFAPDAQREERMGVDIPTSALALDLDGEWAVLVTAEDPAVEWGQAGGLNTPTPGPLEAEKGGADETPLEDGRLPAPPKATGPESPRIRTTGEEALVSPDGETRFVLIFVPRLK